MKDRAVAIIIALALLAFILPAQSWVKAGSTSICFIAINDNVLGLENRPYFENGTTYVPNSVLSSVGVTSIYNGETGLLEVSNGAVPVYFSVSDGKVYDALGSEINGDPAIVKNGNYYLPAVYISNLYGMSCSYIPGADFDAVRINTGSILSDEVFIQEAGATMWEIYSEYTRTPVATPMITPTAPPQPTEELSMAVTPEPQPIQETQAPIQPQPTENVTPPEPVPTPEPTPVATPSQNRSDTNVYITIKGLPSQGLLDILSENQVQAGFFITSQQAMESPEIIRKIIALGHSIGSYCGAGGIDDYYMTNGLIYDAARTFSLLVATGAEYEKDIMEVSKQYDLVYWGGNIDASTPESEYKTAEDITKAVDLSIGRADIRIPGGEKGEELLPDILRHLKAIKYNIRPVRETDGIR